MRSSDMPSAGRILWAAAGALAIAGCGGRSGVEIVVPPEGSGRLTLTWTIDGSAAPEACDASGAARIEVVIYDVAGARAAAASADCAEFSVSIDLPEGVYDADVTLLDDANRPVSTTLTLDDLEIVEGTELGSDIDFPESSMS